MGSHPTSSVASKARRRTELGVTVVP
ncbi:hypothetical protein EYZ11_007293 [Aspergillus tanneri]|uniref:Uncharacterized protein n=1 Tax=Aspergillus tanneri TaxID=1220188 RepID=A0A4S3JDC9_9EURO|nr:hypothetical protein EYZ11_007293 [Aspergillus tanneri]